MCEFDTGAGATAPNSTSSSTEPANDDDWEMVEDTEYPPSDAAATGGGGGGGDDGGGGTGGGAGVGLVPTSLPGAGAPPTSSRPSAPRMFSRIPVPKMNIAVLVVHASDHPEIEGTRD